MPTKPIAVETLRAMVDYDPATGYFTWRARGPEWFRHCVLPERSMRTFNANFAGKPALSVAEPTGYLSSMVTTPDGRRLFRAHRAAIAHVTGKWPSRDVDHINGIRSDNRISNLRECSRSQNAMNQSRPNNASGFKGVGWHKGAWRARIFLDGRSHHLGYYGDPASAARAYDQAAFRHFGAFARLNFPNLER